MDQIKFYRGQRSAYNNTTQTKDAVFFAQDNGEILNNGLSFRPTAGTGLTYSNNTLNHSNSVSADTAKGDNSKTLTFGDSFTIPSVTYNAQGHITSKGTTTMTMPSNPNTDTLVTQTLDSTNTARPVLLSSSTSTGTRTALMTTGVTINPSTKTVTASTFSGDLSGTATKASQDASGNVITTTYATITNVDSKIATAISSVYKPAGSVTFANLPTLGSSLLGNVYNVTDSFTTTSSFLEGAGKTYPAGTNVVVVLNSGSYLYDVLAGFIDLSPYRLKTDTTDSITEGSTNLYFTNARALSATDSTYLKLSGGTMANTNLVTNLNAQYLGGYDSDKLLIKSKINDCTSGNEILIDRHRSDNTFINQLYWTGFKLVFSAFPYIGDSRIATVNDNVASATKLNTARTISLSGGATGTATSFNGTANITIPVTSLDATKLSGTASINTTGNAATATTATNILGLVSGSINLPAWGNLTSSNSYSAVAIWATSNGGGVAFADKGNQTSMQIDGYFYQGEGKNLVLDSSNYNTYAPTKTGTGASGTWGISITGNAATATQDASGNVITSTYATKTEVSTADATLQTNIDKKQATLVSGTNIKTINGTSILGSGNISTTQDLSSYATTTAMNSADTTLQTNINKKQDTLVSATNIKTINGTSLLGSGNITISAGASDWASITNKPFNYTTFSSQPTYFWGTNDGTTYQVYGTSNLNVNSSNYAYGLSSTRKLWGQSFDGTGDVNGTISNCDRIYNAADSDLYLGYGSGTGVVKVQDIESFSGAEWYIEKSGVARFTQQVTSKSFINSNSSNSYVLLGGGGTLALTQAGTTSGVFGGIPVIGLDGVMETGKYLDFHYSDSSTNDYAVRLSCNNDNNVVVYLPSSSGTLALTSAIPTNTTQLTNGSGYITSSALSGYATTSALSSYLPLSGGNMTGTINFYTNGTNCGSIYTNIVSGEYKMYVGTNCDQLYLYSQTDIYANSDLTLDSSSLYITGGGALNVAGASTLTGAVTCSSSITATSFYQSSDKDLKENIKSIANDDTTKLNDIEFKQFNFKSDESKTKHYGVIAQDVVNAGLDNLVSKNDKEELSVDYVSLLVLKIQQLEDRIKQLEDKINGSNSN